MQVWVCMWFVVLLVLQNLPYTTFSHHQHFFFFLNFFFFFFNSGNLDPENPRNIKSNWYGLNAKNEDVGLNEDFKNTETRNGH